MDFWKKHFENKKISLDIFDKIFNKKIKVIDKYNINGSDWFISFELIDDSYILVTEDIQYESKCEYISIRDEENTNLLILIKEGSNNPYTWMIKQLENHKFELWVGGQGGAMNFEMIL